MVDFLLPPAGHTVATVLLSLNLISQPRTALSATCTGARPWDRLDPKLRNVLAMSVAQDQEVILEVNDLRTYFLNRTSTVKAVDGISFNLHRGETLGIVGESGCGKTGSDRSIAFPAGGVAGDLVPQRRGRL